jgi:hypothetical protein
MFGMKADEVTWLDSCVAGTVREAVKGSVKAMHEIRDIMGETSDEDEQIADDGFIDALNGTASEDWADEK